MRSASCDGLGIADVDRGCKSGLGIPDHRQLVAERRRKAPRSDIKSAIVSRRRDPLIVVAVQSDLDIQQEGCGQAVVVLQGSAMARHVHELTRRFIEYVVKEIVAIPIKLIARITYRQAAVRVEIVICLDTPGIAID